MTGPASLSKELQNQLDELCRSARVPTVVRKITDAMTWGISTLRAENDRLNHEVAALSNKCAVSAVETPILQNTPADASEKQPLSFEEVERLRSIVISGVPN